MSRKPDKVCICLTPEQLEWLRRRVNDYVAVDTLGLAVAAEINMVKAYLDNPNRKAWKSERKRRV